MAFYSSIAGIEYCYKNKEHYIPSDCYVNFSEADVSVIMKRAAHVFGCIRLQMTKMARLLYICADLSHTFFRSGIGEARDILRSMFNYIKYHFL